MSQRPVVSPGPPARTWSFETIVLRLILYGILASLIVLALLSGPPPPGDRVRPSCTDNLHNICIALHNYHLHHGSFPPAYTTDGQGNRLHSWRTLLLPWLEQGELYERIDLTKPWDHPVNAAAFAACPKWFRCVETELPDGFTSYLGLVGADRYFDGPGTRSIADMTDGAGSTIAIVEVKSEFAVPWMSPIDLEGPWRTKMSFAHGPCCPTAFADGSLHFLSRDLDGDVFHALSTVAGGEAIREHDWQVP